MNADSMDNNRLSRIECLIEMRSAYWDAARLVNDDENKKFLRDKANRITDILQRRWARIVKRIEQSANTSFHEYLEDNGKV